MKINKDIINLSFHPQTDSFHYKCEEKTSDCSFHRMKIGNEFSPVGHKIGLYIRSGMEITLNLGLTQRYNCEGELTPSRFPGVISK